LVGIHENDTEEQMQWCCDKVSKLRIFEDDEGKMNRSVQDTGGGILVVSQFTLYGNSKKGTRPSFIEAARPGKSRTHVQQND
jgi:D-aminoacyl-tRNA deacylase